MAEAVRNIRKAIRSQAGAFDLPSIIVGVVVVAILAAGVLAAVFGVIPFSQDKSAQQDLDSVRTAQGVAKTRLDGYKDKAGLLAGGLISDRHSLGVATDAKGSCFVGISKSDSGNVFFNTDKTTAPALLTAGVDTGCIDGTTRDTIVNNIGGYGPATSATAAPSASTPSSGPTIVPTSSTGGTGSTGGTSGSTVLAATTWSGQRTITNVYPDPGFKNGIGGWTGQQMVNDYTNAAATTVTYDATAGYNGDAGSMVISATGSTGHDVTTTYLPMDSNPRDYSFWITTPNGTWDPNASWSPGVVYTDLAGNYIGGGSNVQPTRAGGNGANVWERFDASNNEPAPSTPHKTYLAIQADHIPAGQTISMRVDRMLVLDDACLATSDCGTPQAPDVPGYEPNFDGSYPANADFSYSWTGAVNASPSQAIAPKNLEAPTVANPGDTIEIKGTGYAPNSTVTPAIYQRYIYGWYSGDFAGNPVQTDASGNFDTTMLIPSTTAPNNWKVGTVEDTSWPRNVPLLIQSPPFTTPAPGPWSAPVSDSTEQFSVPSTITLGQDFTVVGKGFTPFSTAYVYLASWNTYVYTTTDSNGNFATTMNIPATDPDVVTGPGAGTIYAEGDGYTDPSLSVTFQ